MKNIKMIHDSTDYMQNIAETSPVKALQPFIQGANKGVLMYPKTICAVSTKSPKKNWMILLNRGSDGDILFVDRN